MVAPNFHFDHCFGRVCPSHHSRNRPHRTHSVKPFSVLRFDCFLDCNNLGFFPGGQYGVSFTSNPLRRVSARRRLTLTVRIIAGTAAQAISHGGTIFAGPKARIRSLSILLPLALAFCPFVRCSPHRLPNSARFSNRIFTLRNRWAFPGLAKPRGMKWIFIGPRFLVPRKRLAYPSL